VKGIHNIKAGATYEQTFLTENDAFGIVNPGLLPSCAPALAVQCATLAPYDLTTGGTLYYFRGHTDVKELGLYEQDTITKGAWNINVGLRADLYNGLGASQGSCSRVLASPTMFTAAIQCCESRTRARWRARLTRT
jgi:outer membrane receptor for monomeric catechols